VNREIPSTHKCEWCGLEVEIYHTTEATYNHYHFCTNGCKLDFGNEVYKMTDRMFNVIEHIANGGTPDANNTRKVMRRKGLITSSRKTYYLTQRGKRILTATRKHREKKSLDVL
jgi:hypothetical protein